MSSTASFSLRRALTLERVAAQLIELTPLVALTEIDLLWWQHKGLNLQKREGDQHWRWESIAADYENNPLRICAAALSEENYLEGAIALRFDAKSRLEPELGSVYVGWLATAPRNRKWISAQPFYKGVGEDLLFWAMSQSHLNGLGGRVSLQSLPTPQTREFYVRRGFVRTDENQPDDELINYELPKTAAQMWLQEGG